MKREDDQELWDLLGHAPAPPRFSEFFARNVIRSVREESQSFSRWHEWLRLGRLVPASAMAVALLAVLFVLQQPLHLGTNSDGAPEVVTRIDPKDYDVIDDLDELTASDENNLWDDSQTL